MNRPSALAYLENESIEIIRKSAAALKRLVMLYSIDKEFSILLNLAKKVIYPGPSPFPNWR